MCKKNREKSLKIKKSFCNLNFRNILITFCKYFVYISYEITRNVFQTEALFMGQPVLHWVVCAKAGQVVSRCSGIGIMHLSKHFLISIFSKKPHYWRRYNIYTCSLILTIECSILIERSIYIIECRKFSCGVYIPYFL